MTRLRAWLSIFIPTLLAAGIAEAQPVCRDWSVECELDQAHFLPSDVVTGRIVVRCPSDETSLAGSAYCRQVVFSIVAPNGTATEMVEHGLYGAEARMRIFLGKGEEVLRPVCLVKWAGQFVFALPGEYRITAQVLFEDIVTGERVVTAAPPVVAKVVGTQSPPHEYLAEFDRYSNVCGFFRYSLSHHGVQDLAALRCGRYDESICAFMNYQLWHSGIRSWLRPHSTDPSPTLAEIGRAACRTRVQCGDCRGSWVLNGLESMRNAGHDGSGAGTQGFAFVAGDIVY